MKDRPYRMSEHGRLKVSSGVRRSLADPKRRAEAVEQLSKNRAAIWDDPERRARQVAAMKAGFRRKFADPAARAAAADAAKRSWADPECRARRLASLAAARLRKQELPDGA